MYCNKQFEFANGYITTACYLEKGHKGKCSGFVLGNSCKWDGRYDTEEQEYYGHQVHFDTDTEHKSNIEGDIHMKNRKWLLEVHLEKGTGVNQVKVGELMDGSKTDDECKEIISTLLEAGETREYNENVFLRLGEFEGATKEEAFNNYFESFDGDDQNELFFLHQIDAKELAVECGCGGNCGTSNLNMELLAEEMVSN